MLISYNSDQISYDPHPFIIFLKNIRIQPQTSEK